MCRLAAFPPLMPRQEALNILLDMQGGNLDGVGSVYLNEKGEFIVDKHPCSLTSLFRKGGAAGKAFLSHMPHAGWTVAHLRAASHGGNTMENTHPFITHDGNYAIVHNGIWSDYRLAKLCLAPTIPFKGQTDSEVAANLISLIGPDHFASAIDFGGVYLCLHRNGQLWAIKTSGQLELVDREDKGVILASQFDRKAYWKLRQEVFEGSYHFAANGTFIKANKKESRWARTGGFFNKGYGHGMGDAEWEGSTGDMGLVNASQHIADPDESHHADVILPESASFADGGQPLSGPLGGKVSGAPFAHPPSPHLGKGATTIMYPRNGGKPRVVVRNGVPVTE